MKRADLLSFQQHVQTKVLRASGEQGRFKCAVGSVLVLFGAASAYGLWRPSLAVLAVSTACVAWLVLAFVFSRKRALYVGGAAAAAAAGGEPGPWAYVSDMNDILRVFHLQFDAESMRLTYLPSEPQQQERLQEEQRHYMSIAPADVRLFHNPPGAAHMQPMYE